MKKNYIIIITALFAIACTKDTTDNSQAATGKGGSLARFTIVGNYLYLVDNSSLNTYDISNAASPVFKATYSLSFGVETIYSYKNNLFIGSVDGMYIFSLANPAIPSLLGNARHVRSCDPVVANDSIAYVTLRSGTTCSNTAQEALYVYNIKNLLQPVELTVLPMTTPFGLGLKDTTVFVCRGDSGLSIINTKDNGHPLITKTIRDDIFYDVIPLDDLLICQVKTGLLLYDISDVNNIKQLSRVAN